jgi:hypothetical protein
LWIAALLAPLMLVALSGAAVPEQTLVVLQLNLCNSGISGCYTDRSVARAAELIREFSPDVVSLNEICSGDVSELAQVYPLGSVATGFQSAPDRPTGRSTLCLNGQQFGIGLIVKADTQSIVDGGIYRTQDLTDPEIRAWLCVTAALVACTAHLASTSVAVAEAQCRQLLREIAPAQAVVAGDFNLHEANVRFCVPPDYVRTGDRDVQYVLARDGAGVVTRRVLDMRGTTDHTALLAVLRTSR